MTLFQFFTKGNEAGWSKVLALALLSAVASMSVLATLSGGLKPGGGLQLRPLLWFTAACIVHTISYGRFVGALTTQAEHTLQQVRLRLADKIRGAALYELEELGAAELHEQIARQTTIISNSTWMLALGFQAFLSIIIMAYYVNSLSRPALVAMLLISLIGLPVYYRQRKRAGLLLRGAGADQRALFDGVTDFLAGAKELRLRQSRGAALYAHFKEIAKALRNSSIETHAISRDDYIFINLNLFVLLAVVVFVLPQLAGTHEQALLNLTVAVIFMFSPMSILGNTIPEYERATVAAQSIGALEQRLGRAAAPAAQPTSAPLPPVFRELSAVDLCFRHRDPSGQPGFSVGPFNFSIRSGEIIFFVGGNGSGKTTLLKLLTSLYSPSSGSLVLNGVPIGPDNSASYRELFAAIFTDFHLFSRLYGLADVSPADVNSLLDRMQLSSQTSFLDFAGSGRFSTQNLSTGQRKRLAMIVALLEDRPIYVFDEWAADQDPEFRRFYYQELLPDLKRRGKTVLAISHDDRYFHCADRVFTLEYGTIHSIISPSPAASSQP